MELRAAVAHHRLALAELRIYEESGAIDNAAFAVLKEASFGALDGVVCASERSETDFLDKLKYLAAFYASGQRVSPELWQINGGLLLAVWRRFGWSAEHWPVFPPS